MHIKYRPKSRSEVIGQDHILKSINLDRPVILLGPMGTGKTSIAYILANEFCTKENILEFNCIENNKADDIESILNIFFKSSIFGNSKVLILDEIHGLHHAKAQEELLKPLEKLPDNRKIIACTTEIGKLKPTLVGRFIKYKLKLLSEKDLKILLDYVCDKEGIKLDRWLKILLIEKSEGIARNLLTFLPVVKDITDKEEAEFLLDVKSINVNKNIFELFKFLLSGTLDWLQLSDMLTTILKTESPNSVRVGLINVMCGRLKSKYLSSIEEGKILTKCMNILGNDMIPDIAFLYSALFDIHILMKRK